MHVVTIAAQNYLPMATTLAHSFKRHNPDDSFHILLVDAAAGTRSTDDAYRIITPSDLSLSAAEFDRMAFFYDVTELSTALKPWALEYLLDRGAEVAAYLDPDIYVYDDMSEIERLSAAHGVVLTPHTISPMRRDGLEPSERTIMAAGVYNLGFIAVNDRSREMLTWWQERLSRDAINEPTQMLFTDQRWIDLVPGYFDHVILRDAGYNVAYWNLDNRALRRDGDRVLVNDQPLRFFHFSGFRPSEPWLLSKHTGPTPRTLLSEDEVSRALADDYSAELAARREVGAAVPSYRYNTMPDGSAISPIMRRYYRAALLEAEKKGDPLPPQIWLEGGDAIRRWFQQPARDGKTLTKLQYQVWQARADLHRAFPDPFGASETGLLIWMASSGVAEGAIPLSLCPPPKPETQPIGTTQRGAQIAGYFKTETGVGQIGRLLVDAFRASGIPFRTMTASATVSRENAAFNPEMSSQRYPITIASVNADQFPQWRHEIGGSTVEGTYTIGVWAWEVEEFPANNDNAISLVDEVWAISSFTRDAIQARTAKPVHVMPYQVPVVRNAAPLDRASLGIPSERPYFLFAFDYLSVFERKNPLGVIEAFRSAFHEDEGPLLIIKSVSGDTHRDQRERLRRAASERRDIILIEDYLDKDVVDSLMAGAIAYISLHRSEGYGLTLSESMALGKPVIATAYSGNMDFMTDENSLLVPFRLVPVEPGSGPYPTTTRWADPDLTIAASHMRWVIDNPERASRLGSTAKKSVTQQGSIQRAVEFVTNRVDAILATSPATVVEAQGGAASAQAFVDQAAALVNTPPDVTTASRFPLAARRFRQAVYRVMAHHDQQVNQRLASIVDSVRALQRDVTTDRAATSTRIDDAVQSAHHALGLLDYTERSLSEVRQQLGTVDALRGRLERLEVELFAAERARVDDLGDQADELRTRVDGHSERIDAVVARIDTEVARVNSIESEIVASPYRAEGTDLLVAGADGLPTLGYDASDTESDSGYADFEDVFRGSETFIAERLRPYLTIIRTAAPVVDIGCGRGEMLDLLEAEGIEATGVEIDPTMIKRCEAKGHRVIDMDGAEYLRRLEPDSIGSVVSFQVIEHIPADVLTELFRSAFVALRPGGSFIAETVNPHSPAALKTFWLDLTHVRPLYPESLLFLARQEGFTSARIYFPHSNGDLERDLRQCGEFAIVATK